MKDKILSKAHIYKMVYHKLETAINTILKIYTPLQRQSQATWNQISFFRWSTLWKN